MFGACSLQQSMELTKEIAVKSLMVSTIINKESDQLVLQELMFETLNLMAIAASIPRDDHDNRCRRRSE